MKIQQQFIVLHSDRNVSTAVPVCTAAAFLPVNISAQRETNENPQNLEYIQYVKVTLLLICRNVKC